METEPKKNKIFLNSDVERALRSYLDAKGLDYQTTRKYFEFFHKFANVHGELTQGNVDLFLKYNNHNPARAMLTHLFRAIERWDFPMEMKDSVLRLDIPKRTGKKEKKEPLSLNQKQLEYLIENMKGDSFIDERNRLVILTQWWGGLRISEVLGISYDDLMVKEFDPNKEFQKIRIKSESAKFGKERASYVPTDVYKRIIKYLKRRAFESQSFAQKLDLGESIWNFGKSAYNKLLRTRTERILGRAYNTHSLRHGRTTDLINKGVKIERVQRILGHADISSTQVYVHLTQEDIEESLK